MLSFKEKFCLKWNRTDGDRQHVIKQNNKRVLVHTLLKHCVTHARARTRTRGRCYLRVSVQESKTCNVISSPPLVSLRRCVDRRWVCTVAQPRYRRLSTTLISPRQRTVFIFTELRDCFSTSSYVGKQDTSLEKSGSKKLKSLSYSIYPKVNYVPWLFLAY